MPSADSSASACDPNSSSPTAPTMATEAPNRAAATAWLPPLPPPCLPNVPPVTVSPGEGRRSTATTRSVLIDPTTTTRGWGTAGRVGRRGRGYLEERQLGQRGER